MNKNIIRFFVKKFLRTKQKCHSFPFCSEDSEYEDKYRGDSGNREDTGPYPRSGCCPNPECHSGNIICSFNVGADCYCNNCGESW